MNLVVVSQMSAGISFIKKLIQKPLDSHVLPNTLNRLESVAKGKKKKKENGKSKALLKNFLPVHKRHQHADGK
jgi:hypothetical protein